MARQPGSYIGSYIGSCIAHADFLRSELESETRHEWLDGVVYEMPRGTLEHSRLAANSTSALTAAYPKCDVFDSGAMIFVREAKLSTYADGTVVCGGVSTQRVKSRGPAIGESLLNPTVIVEVLSPSTEQYDRGEKFAHYMRIPSLREYVLVSQDSPKIEVFRRPERGHWLHDEAVAGETIQILDAALAVDEIYRRPTL